jgi:hypothetical protein
MQELARRVAEAQIDLRRVRIARHDLLSRALGDPPAQRAPYRLDDPILGGLVEVGMHGKADHLLGKPFGHGRAIGGHGEGPVGLLAVHSEAMARQPAARVGPARGGWYIAPSSTPRRARPLARPRHRPAPRSSAAQSSPGPRSPPQTISRSARASRLVPSQCSPDTSGIFTASACVRRSLGGTISPSARVCCQSLSATGSGSMLSFRHHAASSPERCSSRWWTRQTGTMNSSLTRRPRARGCVKVR